MMADPNVAPSIAVRRAKKRKSAAVPAGKLPGGGRRKRPIARPMADAPGRGDFGRRTPPGRTPAAAGLRDYDRRGGPPPKVAQRASSASSKAAGAPGQRKKVLGLRNASSLAPKRMEVRSPLQPRSKGGGGQPKRMAVLGSLQPQPKRMEVRSPLQPRSKGGGGQPKRDDTRGMLPRPPKVRRR